MEVSNFIKYLKVDLYRCFLSFRFVAAIIVVLAILLGGMQEVRLGLWDSDVYSYFLFTMSLTPHMLILSAAALAYADSILEDTEHTFIQIEIIRGNLKAFIAARVITIFLSAQMAVTIGGTFFACILRLWLPWYNSQNSMGYYEEAISTGLFQGLLGSGHHLIYLILWNFVYGVAAGTLSLVSSWLSLYIPNRMLILSAPVVVYYCAEQVLSNFFVYFDLGRLFKIDYYWTDNTITGSLLLVGISVGSMLILGCAIYQKIGKELLCRG